MINFPSPALDGQLFIDTNATSWIYSSGINAWTAESPEVGGDLNFKGFIDITAAPPSNPVAKDQYINNTTGTANAGFAPGITGLVNKGVQVVWDGTSWGIIGVQTYTYPGGVEQTVQNRLEQYVSITDFGGVGDCIIREDGVVNQATIDASGSSKGLNTVTDCFVDSDKGKTVILQAGVENGGVNQLVRTVIDKVNSPTQVVLGASLTVGNFSTLGGTQIGPYFRFAFGTDNTTALEAAKAQVQAQYAATGQDQAIYFPPGFYAVNETTVAASNTQYFGAGSQHSKLIGMNNAKCPLKFGEGLTRSSYPERRWYQANDVVRGDRSITMQTPADAATIGTGLKLVISSTDIDLSGADNNPNASFVEIVNVVSVDETAGVLNLDEALTYSYDGVLVNIEDDFSGAPSIRDEWVVNSSMKDMGITMMSDSSPLQLNGSYKIKFDNVHLKASGARVNTNGANRLTCRNSTIEAWNGIFEVKTGSLNSTFENCIFKGGPKPTYAELEGYSTSLPLISVGECSKALIFRNCQIHYPDQSSDVSAIVVGSTMSSDMIFENITIKADKLQYGFNQSNTIRQGFGNHQFRNLYFDVNEMRRLINVSLKDPSAYNVTTYVSPIFPDLVISGVSARNDTVFTEHLMKLNMPEETYPNVIIENVRGSGSVLWRQYAGTAGSRREVPAHFPNGCIRHCVTGYFDFSKEDGTTDYDPQRFKLFGNTRWGEGDLWYEAFNINSKKSITSTTVDDQWKVSNFPALPDYTYGLDKIKFEGSLVTVGAGDHFFTVGDGTTFTPSTAVSSADGDVVYISGEILITGLDYTLTVIYTSNSGTRIETVSSAGDPKVTPYSLTFRAWNTAGSMTIRDFKVEPALYGS